MNYNFLCEIKAIAMMEEVPSSMILNLDHTGLKYVPVSSWTMAKQGSKKVSIAGVDDKRQITGVFTITLDGQFLPPQLIYQGTTSACLPRVKFPNNWHVTHVHQIIGQTNLLLRITSKRLLILTCKTSVQNLNLLMTTMPYVYLTILKGS